MDMQSIEASLVVPTDDTPLNEVCQTQELDPLALSLSPLSLPWAANESLYLSDAGLLPLLSLPNGGELNPATTPHRPNETHHMAQVAMSGSLPDLPAPSAYPPGPDGAFPTIAKAHRTNDTRGRKTERAQGEKKAQAGSATASLPQQEVVITRHGYVDNPLPPAPPSAAPVASETCGPPTLALGTPATAPLRLTSLGPQQEQLQQEPIATPPMLQAGSSLPGQGSHPQCNMGSERDATGAPGVLMSQIMTSQRNVTLADTLLHAVRHWRALQCADVAHGEQALQNARNEQNAKNLGAAPAGQAVLTAGEPENTLNAQAIDDALGAQGVLSALRALAEQNPEDSPAHAWPAGRAALQTAVSAGLPSQGAAHAGGSVRFGTSDAQLPHFAAPQVCSPPAASTAPNLDLLIDCALPVEPGTGGVTDGADFLGNSM